MVTKELDAAVRCVLLSWLPPGLRGAIDAALALGATREQVLHKVQVHTAETTAVYQACAAYLDAKGV